MSPQTEQIFDAVVETEGKFTFVTLPFSPREAWGARPRFSVSGMINGVPVRGTLGALKGDFFLRPGAAWLRDSGIGTGTRVTVRLDLEGPHEGNLAPDILEAFTKSSKAKSFFDGLPTFYRKNFIRWIESAKKKETRAKRIAEMVSILEEGRRER